MLSEELCRSHRPSISFRPLSRFASDSRSSPTNALSQALRNIVRSRRHEPRTGLLAPCCSRSQWKRSRSTCSRHQWPRVLAHHPDSSFLRLQMDPIRILREGPQGVSEAPKRRSLLFVAKRNHGSTPSSHTYVSSLIKREGMKEELERSRINVVYQICEEEAE